MRNESTELPPADSTGRPLMVGDLIRWNHFTAAKRRKVYMYKVVVNVDAAWNIIPNGGYWAAVDVQEIVTKGIDKAHKCRIDVLDRFEIIDGPSVMKPHGLECWWERKKVKLAARIEDDE